MALYVDGLLNNGRAVTHRSRSMSGPSFPPSSCFFGRSRFSEARLLIENTWEPESSRGGFTAGPSTPSSCSSKFPHSRSTRKRLTFCPFSGGSVCGNSLWETNPVLSVPKGTRERRRIERIPSPGEPSLIFAFSRCLSTSLSCRRCSSFHSNKDGVSSFPFFSYSSSPHRVTLHLSPSRQNPRRYHLSVSCISDSGLLRSQSSDASSPTASCSSLPFLSKRTLTNEGNLCLLSLCLPSFPRGTSMLYDKQERGQWVRSFSSLLNFVSPLKSAVGRQLHLDSHFPLPRLREHRESSALSNTAHTRTNASSLSSHSSLVSFPLHTNVPVSALHVASSAGCSLSRSTFASSSISPLRPPSSFGGGLCSSLSAKRLTRGGGIAECRRYYYDSRWVRRLDRLREPKFYQPGPAIQEEEVFDEGKIHPLLKPVSPNWNSRRTGVLAYKVGMMSLWDGWGARHPVTVCQLDRCMVMEQRTLDKDGYEACVMGIGKEELSSFSLFFSLFLYS
ncbi:50s ribosomal protein l3 [Cystoisospora suis]|uniref:50s ribosomal protein l3 n=1 Tax=Cystoisospora suis TaxID=483139 RepID=A0A2C6KZM1_9APIC|nr:50s ribosomal protein l3 [Cystoisospora suis]